MTTATDAATDFITDMYIDGAWTSAGERFDDLNPSTGQVLAKVANGSAEDVDRAVRAARRALEGQWVDTPGVIRGSLLHLLADLIERDSAELARLEALDLSLIHI